MNSPEDVTGISEDEILPDPVLTLESIKNEKTDKKISVSFTPNQLKKLIFIIKGSLSKKIDNELSFKVTDKIKGHSNI